jgi:dTDP-4-amino-4,6-dideoxygalactose transaminase
LAATATAGAIFTDDDELAAVVKSLRVHGQGTDKYDNVRVGLNGRMDTMQAAILLEKLKIFPEEMQRRQRIAARYNAELGGLVRVPRLADDRTSVWAQYTIALPPGRRDGVGGRPQGARHPDRHPLRGSGAPQTAYRSYPVGGNGLPVSERLAEEVLSLPMHPYLAEPSRIASSRPSRPN